MRDFLNIGPCPFYEDAVDIRDENYDQLAKNQCYAYIEEIRSEFGPEPHNTRLAVKGFPHDFGTYYEVVVYYETDDIDSMDYADTCEVGCAWWTKVGHDYLNSDNPLKQQGENAFLLEEIIDRAVHGQFDYSDIFDGDLVDLL